MKYQLPNLGIFALVFLFLSIALASISVAPPAEADISGKTGNVLSLSKFQLLTHVKLGQVTFDYDIVSSNVSKNAVMQIFLKVGGDWEEFTPTDSNGILVLHIFQYIDTTGSFSITLPIGTYNTYRIVMFDAPDGKDADFSRVIWDSSKAPTAELPSLNFTVESDLVPVLAPIMTFPPNPIVKDNGNGLETVTLPGLIKYPTDYQVEGGGFWAMAKGSAGFDQIWASASDAIQAGPAEAPYMEIPISFVLTGVHPGIWNMQFGLFKQSFGDPIQWMWPGMDFEVGGSSWETKAPEWRIPPRLQVINRRFELLSGKPYDFYSGNAAGKLAASFVRGGNYGNAIVWTLQPALDTPGYFTLLAGAGCHYMRFNYDADKYLQQRAYQDSVDQIVENIWAAGMYPIIAPEDLPSGETLQERIDLGDHLLSLVAAKYAGKSVWIEVCNEPHEFSTWAQWKPVAERYVRTIRSIDPNAFVIVPFEGESKDGNGAASNPITDQRVDLYDGHAYLDASGVAPAFASAIKAGLPVIIGEYGSNSPQYLHKMDRTFEALKPAPLAVSPWAFTISGQDSLPLVADGSTADLVLTPAGQAIADDFSSWDNGHKLRPAVNQ